MRVLQAAMTQTQAQQMMFLVSNGRSCNRAIGISVRLRRPRQFGGFRESGLYQRQAGGTPNTRNRRDHKSPVSVAMGLWGRGSLQKRMQMHAYD